MNLVAKRFENKCEAVCNLHTVWETENDRKGKEKATEKDEAIDDAY